MSPQDEFSELGDALERPEKGKAKDDEEASSQKSDVRRLVNNPYTTYLYPQPRQC